MASFQCGTISSPFGSVLVDTRAIRRVRLSSSTYHLMYSCLSYQNEGSKRDSKVPGSVEHCRSGSPDEVRCQEKAHGIPKKTRNYPFGTVTHLSRAPGWEGRTVPILTSLYSRESGTGIIIASFQLSAYCAMESGTRGPVHSMSLPNRCPR